MDGNRAGRNLKETAMTISANPMPHALQLALQTYLAGDTGSAIRQFVTALAERGLGPDHAARAMASFQLTLARSKNLDAAIAAAAWELEDSFSGRSPVWEEIGIAYGKHAANSDFVFVADRRDRV